MRFAHERAVVFGIAAEAAHLGAEFLNNPLAFAGTLAEYLLEAARFAVRGRVFITGDAVDQGGDQCVQRRDFVLTVCHWLTPTIFAWVRESTLESASRCGRFVD